MWHVGYYCTVSLRKIKLIQETQKVALLLNQGCVRIHVICIISTEEESKLLRYFLEVHPGHILEKSSTKAWTYCRLWYELILIKLISLRGRSLTWDYCDWTRQGSIWTKMASFIQTTSLAKIQTLLSSKDGIYFILLCTVYLDNTTTNIFVHIDIFRL